MKFYILDLVDLINKICEDVMMYNRKNILF